MNSNLDSVRILYAALSEEDKESFKKELAEIQQEIEPVQRVQFEWVISQPFYLNLLKNQSTVGAIDLNYFCVYLKDLSTQKYRLVDQFTNLKEAKAYLLKWFPDDIPPNN